MQKYLEINEQKALGSRRCTERNPYSEISQALFEAVSSPESRYGEDEWFIRDRLTGGIYFVDFFNKSTNKIIEFYGDYWHANPKKYKADDMFDFDGGISAEEIWKKNEFRLERLREMGYSVLVIWESDFRTGQKAVIEACNKFLYDN